MRRAPSLPERRVFQEGSVLSSKDFAAFKESWNTASVQQHEDIERTGGEYNSYDFEVKKDMLPFFPVDWTLEDMEIQDRWFLPRHKSDIVGNETCVAAIDAWLGQWNRFRKNQGDRPSKVAMLIRGPPGIGKTTAVRVLLHQYQFTNIHEINTSDDRTKKILQEKIASINMHNHQMAIVLEEVDGMYQGGSDALLPFLTGKKLLHGPLILLANDGYYKFLNDIKKYCEFVQFQDVSVHTMVSRIDQIVRQYNIQWDHPEIPLKICQVSCQDVRKAVLIFTAAARGARAEKMASLMRAFHIAIRSTINVEIVHLRSRMICEMDNTDQFESRWKGSILHQEDIWKDPCDHTLAWYVKSQQYSYWNMAWEDAARSTVQDDCAGQFDQAMSLSITDLKKRLFSIFSDHVTTRDNILFSEKISLSDQRKISHVGSVSRRLALEDARKQAASLSKCQNSVVIESISLMEKSFAFLNERLAVKYLKIKEKHCVGLLTIQRDAPKDSLQVLNYLLRQCDTVEKAVHVAARHEIRLIPDGLFENYARWIPEPRRPDSVTDMTASAIRAARVSNWFCFGDYLRSDPSFFDNTFLSEMFHYLMCIAPLRELRFDNFSVTMPGGKQGWVRKVDSSCTITVVPPVIDSNRGATSKSLQLCIGERNRYTAQCNMVHQPKNRDWLYYNNYISAISTVRARGKMLSVVGSKRESTEEEPVIKCRKMTAQERSRKHKKEKK
jgi:DNA polymerase III delta prime subunit/thymidine kinase